jgi:hypothetical protein
VSGGQIRYSYVQGQWLSMLHFVIFQRERCYWSGNGKDFLPTWSQGTTDVMYWICMLNRQQVQTSIHVFYFSQTIRIDAQASNKMLLQLGHNLAVKIYVWHQKQTVCILIIW